MEHRHDGEDGVTGGDVLDVGQRGDERVEHERPMGVDDTLGAAGRSRRVTHGPGLAFVDLGPPHRLGAGDERLVVEVPLRRRVRAADDDHVGEVPGVVEGLEHLK